ncbi:MAG: hypothetical protein GXO43_02945 [Crenarchaeota archaeon]|nr:hypothetical protein [Thermoproteota archaeon]
MTDLISIIMITTYMTILAIPLLFNHTKIKAGARKKTLENKVDKPITTMSRDALKRRNGVIVVMGELDDKKINEIMRIISGR